MSAGGLSDEPEIFYRYYWPVSASSLLYFDDDGETISNGLYRVISMRRAGGSAVTCSDVQKLWSYAFVAYCSCCRSCAQQA